MNSTFLWLPFYIPEPCVCLPEGWMWLKLANDQEEPVTTFFKSVKWTYLKHSAVLISLSWSLTSKNRWSLETAACPLTYRSTVNVRGKSEIRLGCWGTFCWVEFQIHAAVMKPAQLKRRKKKTNKQPTAADVTPCAGHECQREQIQTRWGVVVCLFVIWVKWPLDFLNLPQ